MYTLYSCSTKIMRQLSLHPSMQPEQRVLVVVATGRSAQVLLNDGAAREKIQRLSGAHMALPLDSSPLESPEVPCILTGSNHEVNKAQSLIAELGSRGAGRRAVKATQPGVHSEHMTIPSDLVGRVIGKSGATVKGIELAQF